MHDPDRDRHADDDLRNPEPRPDCASCLHRESCDAMNLHETCAHYMPTCPESCRTAVVDFGDTSERYAPNTRSTDDD